MNLNLKNTNMNVTFVTAYYDLSKYEIRDKTIEQYLDNAKKLFGLDIQLVIFCEEYMNDFIMEHTKSNKIKIINCKFEFLPYVQKYLKKLETIIENQPLKNGSLKKDTPRACALWYSKTTFLRIAMELNLYLSTHFVWIDFGIMYIAQNWQSIETWKHKIRDKIRCLSIRYRPMDQLEQSIMFITGTVAGGLLSGNIQNMQKFINLVDSKIHDAINNGWYQLEQYFWLCVLLENKELHDVYFGDYQNIIENYDVPTQFNILINLQAQEFIKNNDIEMIRHILEYMKSGTVEFRNMINELDHFIDNIAHE